ncbi:NUDIX domain-containing protein [Kitasatospora aureofaciens]|uniref:NUDIX hydrolase n=1 Tax=Kitasatospora aureofaciens TaxID=1894 RepID=UPI001C44FB9C|nr:NUDIX domain-containing protein [Kitasatospora aureofaciens]MBV6699366.1 NUDIX domain-containing protein [Kitasatospora aureofaciens]
MIQRVRAILVTPNDGLLLIKRVRPGRDPYWVFPGGHVESDDSSLEAALDREIHEEIAGKAKILSLVHVLEDDEQQQQMFYLCEIAHWSFDDRTGDEFTEADRGEYALEEIPLTSEALSTLNLMPPETAGILRDAVAAGRLLCLPDLRVH